MPSDDWCPENDGAYRAEMAALMQARWEEKVGRLMGERDAAVARAEAAEAKLAGLREALTPSGDTKADYIGEIRDPDTGKMVSWAAIKLVMKMIAARADLAPSPDVVRGLVEALEEAAHPLSGYLYGPMLDRARAALAAYEKEPRQ